MNYLYIRILYIIYMYMLAVGGAGSRIQMNHLGSFLGRIIRWRCTDSVLASSGCVEDTYLVQNGRWIQRDNEQS